VREALPKKPKLQKGDSIVGINGKQLFIFQDIAAELNASKNSEVEILFVRDGQLMQSQLQVNENGKLGVGIRQAFEYFPTKRVEYGFFEAIPAGISLGWETWRVT